MLYRSLLRLTNSGSYWSTTGKIQVASYSSRKTHHVLLAHTVYDPPNSSEEDLENANPVLITHGLLGSKQNWTSIAKAMARNINKRVITFDARNHGDSPHTKKFSYLHMADDILNLVQHLRIDQFTLMGHSMGGRSAMAFALKYPDMLERLVVVDVSPLSVNADFPTMKIYVHALRELEIKYGGTDTPVSEVRKLSDTALKAIVIDPSVRAFLLTNLTTQDGKIAFKPNLQGLLDKFDEVAMFPVELLDDTYEGPTLFIRGQKSLYIPLTDFPRIKQTFVNAKLATVEHAGHWPHSENTVQFMEILLPFVKGDV